MGFLSNVKHRLFSDPEPAARSYGDLDEKNTPQTPVSFLESVTFSYINPVLDLGFTRPLGLDDLPAPNTQDAAQTVCDELQTHWDEELLRPKPSLTRACLRTFGAAFVAGNLFKVPQDLLVFMGPFLLQQLVTFIDPDLTPQKDATAVRGFGLLVALMVAQVAQSCFLQQYFHRVFRTAMHARAALGSFVYVKALALSNDARQQDDFSTGAIVNMMQVDVERINQFIPYCSNLFWSSPLQIAVCVTYLYLLVGYAAFAGFGAMVAILPLNIYAMTLLRTIQEKNMSRKDERVRAVSELLSGIRVLKLFAWEGPASKRVLDLRALEVKALFRFGVLGAAQGVLWSSAPAIVALTIFAVYTSQGNVLTLSVALPVLSLISILQFPLAVLPWMLMSYVGASIATKRLQGLLLAPAIVDTRTRIPADQAEVGGVAVQLKGARVEWEEGKAALQGVDLTALVGDLVAVVGPVGAGKSTLLSALLGEAPCKEGSVSVIEGRLGYVPQQAWVLNASVKDNILMGQPFDEAKYARAVHAASLQQDLEALPAGDSTEIGERGINLSGGQKQRVSMARAVYSEASIFLMDDPLSAVDSHVAAHMFQKCILGAMSGATRILVTHRVDLLRKVPKILALKDGKVQGFGTYQELIEQGIDLDEHQDDQEHTDQNPAAAATSASDGKMTRVPSGDKEGAGEKEAIKPQASLITEEERKSGEVSGSTWKVYFESVGTPYLVSIFLTGILSQLARMAVGWWVSRWASEDKADDPDVTEEGQTMRADTIRFYLWMYLVLTIAEAFSTFLRDLALNLGALRASTKFHNRMLQATIRSPVSFFDATPLGRILNRFSKDQESADSELPRSINELYSCMLAVIGPLVLTVSVSPFTLIGILPVSVVYFRIFGYFRRTYRELKRLDATTRSPIYAHFTESLGGVASIRALSLLDQFQRDSKGKIDDQTRVYWPMMTCNRWLSFRLEFCGSLFIITAAAGAVGARLLDAVDHNQAALLGLSIMYVLGSTQELSWMVRQSIETEASMNSIERLDHYGNLPSEAPEEAGVDATLGSDWPQGGEVIFSDVKMRYREGTPLVLNSLSLYIKPGEKVGVVGRTGAGKSSLIVALFRLCELDAGSIKIDGNNIGALGLRTLRSRLAIVPQDPVLYSGSFRFNLDPYNEYSDEQIWAAIDTVNMRQKVGSLDEKVSEGGSNMSVGERQLLCMSRALLKKARIVILDEATAAVDMATDALIQTALREQCVGRTVITVAHRLNTIMDYDKVLVMAAGRMLEYASPQELAADPTSEFAAMLRSARAGQAGGE